MLPAIGFAWTVRVIGFASLGGCCVSVVTVENRLPPRRKSGPWVSTKIFRDSRFILLTVGNLLVALGTYFPLQLIWISWLTWIIRIIYSINICQSFHCDSHNLRRWAVLCPRSHERTGSSRPNRTSHVIGRHRSIQLLIPLCPYRRSLLSLHMDGGTNGGNNHDICCIIRLFCWSIRLPHYPMHRPNIGAQGNWDKCRNVIHHNINPVSFFFISIEKTA